MALYDEFVGITGPMTKVASGRFKSDGETPIYISCSPYWVVRYVGCYPYAVLKDVRFQSLKSAEAFRDKLIADYPSHEEMKG